MMKKQNIAFPFSYQYQIHNINPMKQNDKKNMITAIQNNLKIMKQQAQQFKQKHHSNLPPICAGRHYLFQSININKTQSEISQLLNSIVNKKEKIDKNLETIDRSQEKSIQLQPKATIYNLQFIKKIKPNQHTHQTKNLSTKNSLMNSTSLRLRMSGNFRSSRYAENLSSRSSIEGNDKVKTILLNSQVIDLAQKDLRFNGNLNYFSPKLQRFDLSKKESDVLKRYFSKFKNQKWEQSKTSPAKMEEIINQSAGLLDDILSKEVESKEHCSSRRRRYNRRTIDNPQSIRDNQKLQKQLLRLTKFKKANKVNKKAKKQMVDAQQGDYTPWGYEQKAEQLAIFDFS